jgi:hypothetical protein
MPALCETETEDELPVISASIAIRTQPYDAKLELARGTPAVTCGPTVIPWGKNISGGQSYRTVLPDGCVDGIVDGIN